RIPYEAFASRTVVADAPDAALDQTRSETDAPGHLESVLRISPRSNCRSHDSLSCNQSRGSTSYRSTRLCFSGPWVSVFPNKSIPHSHEEAGIGRPVKR